MQDGGMQDGAMQDGAMQDRNPSFHSCWTRGSTGRQDPPSPIQEGPFPQSSCPPRGESNAIIGLKPAILVPQVLRKPVRSR